MKRLNNQMVKQRSGYTMTWLNNDRFNQSNVYIKHKEGTDNTGGVNNKRRGW